MRSSTRLRTSLCAAASWLVMLAAAASLNLLGAQSANATDFVMWSAPTGTLGWCTPYNSPGNSRCFADPMSACVQQFQAYATTSTDPGYKESTSWSTKECTWNWHIGSSQPTLILWTCATGYVRVAPGRCTTNGQNNKIMQCGANGGGTASPATPFPIDILTGSKRLDREDFATADRSIVLSRHFESGGTPGSLMPPVPQYANWQSAYGLSLDLSTLGTLADVYLYDGRQQSVPYKLSSGTLVYDNQTNWFVPNNDYAVALVGTWPSTPATLRNATSQWTVRGADLRQWILQTVIDPRTGKYDLALPTMLVEPSGATLTFTYGAQNRLASITDQFGKTVSFTWNTRSTYDTSGNLVVTPVSIAAVDLPGGYKLRYTYSGLSSASANERLTKVEWLDPLGAVLDAESYDYGNAQFPRNVTAIRDGAGAIRWTVTYDGLGRATLSQGPNGEFAYSVAYGAAGATFNRTVTNPLGRSAIYNYTLTSTSFNDARLTSVQGQATAHCPASAQSLTYNGYLIATATDEEGRVTKYTRNGKGQPTQIIEAFGTSLARTTNITWNPSFNLPDQVTQTGLTVNFVYDTQGRLTSRTETDTTTFTTPYPTNGRARTWTYAWNTAGQLTSVNGPLAGSGDTVSYGYDANGYLQTITNQVGQVTTVTAVDWRGAPLTLADANGVTRILTYDVHGRVLTSTLNPGAAQSQYQFSYDTGGNLARITLPSGSYLNYSYDAGGRLTAIANDVGETITLTPNAAGEPTAVAVKTAGAAVRAQQSDAYDELGRLIQVVGAGSETWGFGYDKVDNLVQTTDARSKVFGSTIDALNRVSVDTDPEAHTVQYAYDVRDNLNKLTDGRGLQTNRKVDGFGRTIEETSPDRGTLSYWYDLADHLTKTVDGDGQQTDYVYDAAGRLQSATFAGASAETITYGYDATAAGNYGIGHLTTVTDQSGSSAFTYDAQGRLVQDQKTIQGRTYQVGYEYDVDGQVTKIILPSGRAVTFARTGTGEVSGISTVPSGGSAQVLVSNVIYEPFGPLASLDYANGLALTRSHDQNYWLTGIHVTGGGTTALDVTFARNANGQLSSVTDNAATGRAATFGYSDAGRLTQASGAWGGDAYAYDAAGNRTSKSRTVGSVTTSESVTMASGSNRALQVLDGGSSLLRSLTYRTGGDLSQAVFTGGPTFDYGYSARKRLSSVQRNGVTVAAYGYDFRGQRVWRSVTGPPGSSSHYIFDRQGHLLAEHDGATGALLREYVWLDDMLVALIDSSSGAAQTYFVHTGQSNEPLVLTDTAKSKVWDAAIEPFGSAVIFGTPSQGVNLRLPGQWEQAETGGLFQNWNRDYDPSLGRYVEADPLGIEAGQNPYAYAAGDPLDQIDPTGLDIVVLNDSSSVFFNGHTGVLIGNDAAGWQYLSKDGPGTGNFSSRPFATLAAARASLRRYDRAVRIRTTRAQDAAALTTGLQQVSTRYDFATGNCADLVERILSAARVDFYESGVANDFLSVPNVLYGDLRARYGAIPW